METKKVVSGKPTTENKHQLERLFEFFKQGGIEEYQESMILSVRELTALGKTRELTVHEREQLERSRGMHTLGDWDPLGEFRLAVNGCSEKDQSVLIGIKRKFKLHKALFDPQYVAELEKILQ